MLHRSFAGITKQTRTPPVFYSVCWYKMTLGQRWMEKSPGHSGVSGLLCCIWLSVFCSLTEHCFREIHWFVCFMNDTKQRQYPVSTLRLWNAITVTYNTSGHVALAIHMYYVWLFFCIICTSFCLYYVFKMPPTQRFIRKDRGIWSAETVYWHQYDPM